MMVSQKRSSAMFVIAAANNNWEFHHVLDTRAYFGQT
jgi:hypothetical protein